MLHSISFLLCISISPQNVLFYRAYRGTKQFSAINKIICVGQDISSEIVTKNVQNFSFEISTDANSSKQFLTTFDGLLFCCLTCSMQELMGKIHTFTYEQASKAPKTIINRCQSNHTICSVFQQIHIFLAFFSSLLSRCNRKSFFIYIVFFSRTKNKWINK